MKRGSRLVMGAALALALCGPAYAQNPEFHVFLTDLGASFDFSTADSNNDGVLDGAVPTLGSTPTGNPTMMLLPGQMTTIGIWMNLRQADQTAAYSLLGAGWRVFGSASNALHRAAANWYVDSLVRNPGAGYGTTAPGMGNAVDHLASPPAAHETNVANNNNFSLVTGSGFGATGATGASPTSGSSNYFLGAFKVMVPGSAVNNDKLQIYLSNFAALRKWTSTGSTAGTRNTLAFGFNGTTPDAGRLDTTGELNGLAAADFLGTDFADATIMVIPEPATMGLLALGLLGLRRRRKA